MTTIDIALIPPFLAVADCGSFSAAARRLKAEKSSVSRAVARLERAMGAPLFLRSTRKVALSSTGQVVYARLREPFSSMEGALQDLANLTDAPSGKILITAPTDFGSVILPDVVARFLARHPHVEVELRFGSALQDVVGGGFDVAIRIAPKPLRDSSMKARNVGEIQLGLFASPLYIEQNGAPKTPQEAASHSSVVFPSTRSLALTGPKGDALKLTSKGRVACDDMFFVHHAVLSGLGLGVLPRFLGDPEVARGRLVRLLPAWSVLSGHIWFMTPGGREVSRAVSRFRDLLIESLAMRGMRPSA